MKKLFIFILFLLISLFTTACNNKKDAGCRFTSRDKIKVCTTLFPQYDFAKQIGGDLVEVKLLIQPGVEAHSYEPTALDIVHLNKADLFIYTNPIMEPWVIDKIAHTIENKDLIVLNASQDLSLIDSTSDHDEEGHEHHGDSNLDPHVWTSINNVIIMMDTILTQLIQLDPKNEQTYRTNAQNYQSLLLEIDEQFKTLFSNSDSRTIIHGGHGAFGYFAHDYQLSIESVFTSLSPNEELKVDNIQHIIELLKTQDHPILYHEELIDAKAARMIKTELKGQGIDIELKLLHGFHNISKQELDDDITYLAILKQNFNNLKVGFTPNE